MGLFGKKTKSKPRRSTGTPEERQERTEKREAWSLFTKQMKVNPNLEQAYR
jgi:hypothetical protein